MNSNSNIDTAVEPAVLAGALDTFRSYLAGKDLRFTGQRRLVIEEAFCCGAHFDAEDLCAAVRASDRNVSTATVYRTLGHMRECGLIKEVLRSHGRAHYEVVFGHQHHDHLLCVRCNRTIEFCDERIEALQGEVCREYGFRPLEHRMGIRGVCRECRAEGEERGG